MGGMMWFAGLYKHPDDDSEKPADFWHGAILPNRRHLDLEEAGNEKGRPPVRERPSYFRFA